MKKLLYLLLLTTGLGACGGSSSGSSPSFDRKAMLQNYADNLIIPAYTQLQTDVNALKTAIDNLNKANLTAADLTIAQNAWAKAYTSWQYANAYNFGEAGESGLRKTLFDEIGVFPVNTTQIETLITANNTDTNNFARDTRGFLAIEYLVFDLNNTQTALNKLQNASRRNYLVAITNHLKSNIDRVTNSWANYKTTFVNSTGTDVGSSTSILYNEFVKSYENLKNFKVQLPAGKRAGQTAPEPTRVEAYYSAKSLEMLKLHLTALENVWYGKSADGKDGIGFVEYLEKVNGGTTLIASTQAQLTAVKAALDKVPTTVPLATSMQNNNTEVNNLSVELQKHTRFFKSDMSSLLGIAITYSSGDGD